MADLNDDIEAMLHPLPPPLGINDAPTPNALAHLALAKFVQLRASAWFSLPHENWKQEG